MSSREAAADEDSDSTRSARQLSIVSRGILLGALIGVAVVAWAQFTFDARWVTRFLVENRLGESERRTLIVSLLAGGGVGAALSYLAFHLAAHHKVDFEKVERWLWFISPLALLPVLPLLFRYKAWRDRHEDLLPALFVVGLVLEVLAHRCLSSVPNVVQAHYDRAIGWWRSQRRAAFIRQHGFLIAVICGAVLYAVFMSFFAIRWHYKLGTGNYDLGINNNLLYGGLFGDFNHSRIVFPHDPQKYLANHVKVGVYVFLPIYALCPRPETLQVIQSTLLGMGAIPIFLFARRRIAEFGAVLIAFSWLCYYPLHGANFYEVKMVPMASFFVLMTVWAADTRRYWVMGLCALIGMLMREDMPVGFAVVGAFLLLTGHRPVAGLVMGVLAASWFAFLRFYVMDQIGEWWFPKMYKDLWADGEGGFQSVVKTLISNPFFTFKHVFLEKKLVYMMHLLVPLMFLPARRWYLWAAFLPGAVLTLLVTDYKPVTMFSFQYVMHWAPYMFLAIPLALSAYQKVDKARAHAALAAMTLASAVLTYNYGAFSMRDKALRAGYHKIEFSFSDEERQRYAQLLEIIKFIEPEASVVTSEKVGPHVSSRRVFYSLRRDHYHADYILAREKGMRLDRSRASVSKGLVSGEYGVYKRVGDFVLMKRGYQTTNNQAVIDEWELLGKRRRRGEATAREVDDEDDEDDAEAVPEKARPLERRSDPTAPPPKAGHEE